MYKYLLVGFFSLMAVALAAQDQIYYADGVMKEGKVQEISKDHLIIQEDGERYKVPRREVAMVVYANGDHEIFNKGYARREDTKKVEDKPVEGSSANSQGAFVSKKPKIPNQIKFNLAALTLGNVEVSYQRFITNSMAIEIPIVAGFQTGFDDYYFRKAYSLGVNLLFYPIKSAEKVKFYVGPGFDFGNGYVSSDMKSDFWYSQPYGTSSSIFYRAQYQNYFSIMAKLGLTMQMTESFSTGVEVGPGLRQFVGTESFTMPKIDLNINLKYHF